MILGSGRTPGGGHGNALHYSCLENPIDCGAWQAIVHWVAESDMTEESLHARILNSILEQKETSGNVGEAQIKSVI